MSKEVRGKFGSIEGVYKKETTGPIILKPCEHLVHIKERSMKPDIIVRIHGKDNGETSMKEHEIGSTIKK